MSHALEELELGVEAEVVPEGRIRELAPGGADREVLVSVIERDLGEDSLHRSNLSPKRTPGEPTGRASAASASAAGYLGQQKGANVSPSKALCISRLSVAHTQFHKLIWFGPR